MKKSKILLAVLAVVMVLTLSIGSAAAYFYAAATTDGVATVKITPPSTEIEEDPPVPGLKQITIKNTGEVDVFVRAKAIAPVPVTGRGSNWTGPDAQGWYNYNVPVPVGQNASKLTLTFPMDELTKEQLADLGITKDGDMLNVVVVYEAVPVSYDANGNPYADWTQTIELVEAPKGGD